MRGNQADQLFLREYQDEMYPFQRRHDRRGGRNAVFLALLLALVVAGVIRAKCAHAPHGGISAVIAADIADLVGNVEIGDPDDPN